MDLYVRFWRKPTPHSKGRIRPGFLQAQQEVGVAGKPIQLRDHQRGAVELAGVQRLVQRWTVLVVLAALYLDVLLDQLPAATVEERGDSMALGVKAETTFTLPLGADPQVADELAVVTGHGSADLLLADDLAAQTGLVVTNVLDQVDVFQIPGSFRRFVVSGDQDPTQIFDGVHVLDVFGQAGIIKYGS